MERQLKKIDALRFTITNDPVSTDRDYLQEQIKSYNNQTSPHHQAARKSGIEPLALFIRDEQGQLLGGLAGDTYWGWLEIDNFWIGTSLRKQGFGQELLLAAETEAALRGCTRAHLQTFDFQARYFYEKFGYRVVGQLDDYPPGQTFFWMRKDFGRTQHVSFQHLHTDNNVLAYLVQLNRNYPKRPAIIQHIEAHVAGLPFNNPHVVELCFGPGMLARHLIGRLPHIKYTGFDYSEPFGNFVRQQLALAGYQASVRQADLNTDGWWGQLTEPVQAIISLQSLHDLGNKSSVSRIYRLAKQLLVSGGMLLNADLIVPSGQPNPNNPGRLSVEQHLELLQTYGFQGVACTLNTDGFACIVGFA